MAGKKLQEKNEKETKSERYKKFYLAEGVSKSRAGDTGSDDDYVDVAISGSVFAVNGRDIVDAFGSSLFQRRFPILVLEDQIVHRDKAEYQR